MEAPRKIHIRDDKHMLDIMLQGVNDLIDNDKVREAIPFPSFLALTYLKLVADARLRTGSNNYDLLQDIATAELTEAIDKTQGKMNKEQG